MSPPEPEPTWEPRRHPFRGDCVLFTAHPGGPARLIR